MPAPAWMATIPNNGLTLKELTLPASHDAGVSDVHNDSKNLGTLIDAGRYICQSQDIAGQLNSGARFFDLRFSMKTSGNGLRVLAGVSQAMAMTMPLGGPATGSGTGLGEWDTGTATTVHETAGSGGWGETAQSVFKAIDAHLRVNTQEIVIVRVSHTDSTAGAEVVKQQQACLAATRTYTGPAGQNLANVPIRSLRGKAIVAYASDALAAPDPTHGTFRFGKASSAGRVGIVTCGEFPNSDDMALIFYKSVKRTNEHRRNAGQSCNSHTPLAANDHLFMLYWQMTGGIVRDNTLRGGGPVAVAAATPRPALGVDSGNGTHYNLSWLLATLEGSVPGNSTHGHTFKADSTQARPLADLHRYRWVPNLINLDFVNDAVCAAIIAFNQRSLTDAGQWIVVA